MWKIYNKYSLTNPILSLKKNLKPVNYIRINWLNTYLKKNSIKVLNNPKLICSKINLDKPISLYQKRMYLITDLALQSSWFKINKSNQKKPFEIETIRNTPLNLSILHTYQKIVLFADLPVFFDKGLFNVLRYAASLYGINSNSDNPGLCLTMGLKKNIAVPFRFFFKTNKPRRNIWSSINKKSWNKYLYLVKNSFVKGYKFLITKCENFYMNESNNDFLVFADLCNYIRRRKFKFHRALPVINDIDYSISTYHATFDYFDLRQRAIFCWISNNNLFRESAFFIRSYDPSIILYPHRYFKYRDASLTLAKFHRSWFFLNKVQNWSNNSTLITNLKIIDIYLKINMQQFWLNFSCYADQSILLRNFRILLFFLLKNNKYSKIWIYLNKFKFSAVAFYVFFNNSKYPLNIKFFKKNNSTKQAIYNSWVLNQFLGEKNLRFKMFKWSKLLLNLKFNMKIKWKNMAKWIKKYRQKWNLIIKKNYGNKFNYLKLFSKFKLINWYHNVSGLLKMRPRRMKFKKGLMKYQSVSIRSWLRFKKGYKKLVSYRRYKAQYKFSKLFIGKMRRFCKSLWNAIFALTSQINLYWSINLFNQRSFTFFRIHLFYTFDKIFIMYLEMFCTLKRWNPNLTTKQRSIYLKKLVSMSSFTNSSLKSSSCLISKTILL